MKSPHHRNHLSRLARRLPLRYRLALWFWAVGAASTLLVAGVVYRVVIDAMVAEFGQKLQAVAASAALGIEGETFARLQRPEQMGSPEYLRIQAHLRRVREANSTIRFRYLYTMAPTSNPGTWRYVVDSEAPGAAGFSPLGQSERLRADDPIQAAYRTGRGAADPQVREYGEWGLLLTAAAPIRDRAGRMVGIVGVDAPALAVRDARAGIFRATLGALVGGLVLALLVGSLVSWGVTRPLAALVHGTEAVNRGDFDHRVTVQGGDELGQLANAFNTMIHGLRQRDLYKRQFERYVSRQIAEKILSEPDRAFWQGERRRATILFSDIRGFTPLAEQLPPEEVVTLLNEYLGGMIDIVFEHEGTLDKFMGDAIMAVFGAPVSTGNDEERAVRAALAMKEAVDSLSRRWEAEGRGTFRIGIGINTGEVVVGNIGSELRLEYAAIGDHVNLAARLETLNKEYGTEILISESTYQSVSHLVECRWVDRVCVRGRSQEVDVYEVLGPRDHAANGRERQTHRPRAA